jgi:hypothetical protein
MGDPVRQGVGLPRARAGDDQERPAWRCVVIFDAVLNGSSLVAIEGLEIADGHRWEIGVEQANQSTMFLVLFATLLPSHKRGDKLSSTVVPAESKTRRSPAEHCC